MKLYRTASEFFLCSQVKYVAGSLPVDFSAEGLAAQNKFSTWSTI